MRTIDFSKYDLVRVWQDGHHGPSYDLVFKDARGTHRLPLGAGLSDSINVFREGTITYVLSYSTRHDYIACVAFDTADDTFATVDIQDNVAWSINSGINEELDIPRGRDWSEYTDMTQVKYLANVLGHYGWNPIDWWIAERGGRAEDYGRTPT